LKRVCVSLFCRRRYFFFPSSPCIFGSADKVMTDFFQSFFAFFFFSDLVFGTLLGFGLTVFFSFPLLILARVSLHPVGFPLFCLVFLPKVRFVLPAVYDAPHRVAPPSCTVSFCPKCPPLWPTFPTCAGVFLTFPHGFPFYCFPLFWRSGVFGFLSASPSPPHQLTLPAPTSFPGPFCPASLYPPTPSVTLYSLAPFLLPQHPTFVHPFFFAAACLAYSFSAG